jgi:hypothetical protein
LGHDWHRGGTIRNQFRLLAPELHFNRVIHDCGLLNKLNGTVPKKVPSLTTRSVSFEVALFRTGEDQRCENKGTYHNPTRQRGIFANTAETEKRNPSLTQRVVICKSATSKSVSEGSRFL